MSGLARPIESEPRAVYATRHQPPPGPPIASPPASTNGVRAPAPDLERAQEPEPEPVPKGKGNPESLRRSQVMWKTSATIAAVLALRFWEGLEALGEDGELLDPIDIVDFTLTAAEIRERTGYSAGMVRGSLRRGTRNRDFDFYPQIPTPGGVRYRLDRRGALLIKVGAERGLIDSSWVAVKGLGAKLRRFEGLEYAMWDANKAGGRRAGKHG